MPIEVCGEIGGVLEVTLMSFVSQARETRKV